MALAIGLLVIKIRSTPRLPHESPDLPSATESKSWQGNKKCTCRLAEARFTSARLGKPEVGGFSCVGLIITCMPKHWYPHLNNG